MHQVQSWQGLSTFCACRSELIYQKSDNCRLAALGEDCLQVSDTHIIH